MVAFFRQRLRPPVRPPGSRVPRDLPLDGLRGMCALLVFYAHLFLPLPILDPGYSPSPRFHWFDLGSAAVLMFFVLSGYVIGLTVAEPPSPGAMRRYVSRRVLRLAPITYAAVLVSCLLLPAVGGRTILAHLLFLHNNFAYPWLGWMPLLSNNPNLWSLHYEAVYYAGFLVIWRLAPAPGWIFAGLGVLATGFVAGLPMPPLATRYACGGLFWLSGLCLAWRTDPPAAGPRGNWPAALLAAYALWYLRPVRELLVLRGIFDVHWPTAVLPHRLDFLPVCVWVILAVTGRGPRLRLWLTGGCLAWGVAGAAGWVGFGAPAMPQYLAMGALVGALALARRNAGPGWLARLAPVGGISFAIYVLAMPVQFGVLSHGASFSGTAVTYALRLVLTVGLVVSLAWLLEHRLQPWLAARWPGRR
ncbi:MAG: acyltransferase family protein [Opitutales bacterium]